MLGETPFSPDAVLVDPSFYATPDAPFDDATSLAIFGPALFPERAASPPQPIALAPYDQWGAIRIPTVGTVAFTPVATGLWVKPASVPVGDPCLAVILDFLATFLNTDANATVAYSAVCDAKSALLPVGRIFPHDPSEVVFSEAHLPGLYMWRADAKQEYLADDWLEEITTVKGLWVYPLAQQANQRARQPLVNAIVKCIGTAIERGRTPSWVQPGDPEHFATLTGSLFYTFAGFEQFKLVSWRQSKLDIIASDRSKTDSYPAVELTFELWEKQDVGLLVGAGRALTGSGLQIFNPQGVLVDAGPLGNS